jgi:DnaA family protein
VSQLVLDLGPPPAPTFANFVAGDNGEALAAMRALAGPARDAASRFVYLWGPRASGRSHLLQALAGAVAPSRVLGPGAPEADFVHDARIGLWVLDDCDALDARRQAAAFHLFDAVAADANAALASAGTQPPARLALMPELATRLGWGLVLQLRPLSDADAARALERMLGERGIVAAPDAVPWLMTHAPRDLGSLRALVDAIDRYALARRRALTVPLLREFAQAELALRPAPPVEADPPVDLPADPRRAGPEPGTHGP